MLRAFGRYIRRNVVRFVESHERSFRTDIILLPTLVGSIEILSKTSISENKIIQISAVIGLSVLAYLVGLVFITLIGDSVWARVFYRLHPIRAHRSIYLQVTSIDERKYSLAELFFDKDRRQYVHRGVAFSASGKITAAWDASYTRYATNNGPLTIQFSGKSRIYDSEKDAVDMLDLRDDVFFFIRMTNEGHFVGAGLDFGSEEGGKSFGLQGYNIRFLLEEKHMNTELLRGNTISISKKNVDKIIAFHSIVDALRD